MCMRNVNATMLICSSVDVLENKSISLNSLYNSVVPIKESDKYYVDNMNIVLNCSVLFDDRLIGEPNCMDTNKTYQFMIRLTHVATGKGIALTTFNFDTSEDKIKTLCRKFIEITRILKVSKLELPMGLGDYALKLLIREKTEDENAAWSVQTIHHLLIGDYQ